MPNRKWIAVWISMIMFGIQAHGQWIDVTDGLPDFTSKNTIDACSDSIAIVPIRDTITAEYKLFQTLDFGINWIELPIPSGATRVGIDISIIDADHIWVLDVDKIYATSDRGTTWDTQFYDTTMTKYLQYIEMLDLDYGVAMGDCADGRDGAAVILKTSDGGLNWISVNDSAFGGHSLNLWWPIDFVNFDVGYFLPFVDVPRKLYKTQDGGSTWRATNYPGSKMDIVKFYDENIGLAVYGQDSYRTMDGGETWEYFNSPECFRDIEFSLEDPSEVWAGMDYELFYSSDTGRTWIKQFDYRDYSYELGRGIDDVVFTSSDHGWLLAHSAVFYTSNSGGFTNVPDERKDVPRSFSLDQNFPNPFNPQTGIPFRVAKSCWVTLKVFDLLGREMATLVDKNHAPGEYIVLFNGEGFASGIYFYRLQAGGFTTVRKMVLMQ